jgi:hypothetical protein
MNDEKEIKRLNHLGSHHRIEVRWSDRQICLPGGHIEITHQGKVYFVARHSNWVERVQTWIAYLAAKK